MVYIYNIYVLLYTYIMVIYIILDNGYIYYILICYYLFLCLWREWRRICRSCTGLTHLRSQPQFSLSISIFLSTPTAQHHPFSLRLDADKNIPVFCKMKAVSCKRLEELGPTDLHFKITKWDWLISYLRTSLSIFISSCSISLNTSEPSVKHSGTTPGRKQDLCIILRKMILCSSWQIRRFFKKP